MLCSAAVMYSQIYVPRNKSLDRIAYAYVGTAIITAKQHESNILVT